MQEDARYDELIYIHQIINMMNMTAVKIQVTKVIQ